MNILFFFSFFPLPHFIPSENHILLPSPPTSTHKHNRTGPLLLFDLPSFFQFQFLTHNTHLTNLFLNHDFMPKPSTELGSWSGQWAQSSENHAVLPSPLTSTHAHNRFSSFVWSSFFFSISISVSVSYPQFSLFLPSSICIWFFFLSSLFLSQLFLVGLNQWLLGLKWWVVSVVARFRSVMVGFGGGHLDVGWVSRWRSGLRLGFWVSVVSWSQFLCLNSNCGWYGEWWRRGLN